MLIALRFNLSVDYNIELPQNKAETSKAEASSSFKGFGFFKTLNSTCFNSMRVRFVPPPYRKELLLKLQRLHQGPRTVDEYFKNLETTLTKINMHDNEESKIL